MLPFITGHDHSISRMTDHEASEGRNNDRIQRRRANRNAQDNNDREKGRSRRGRPPARTDGSGSPRTYNSGRWSDREKHLFLLGLRKFGRGKWKNIGELVLTRSLMQIKSHGQKVLEKIDAGEDVFAILLHRHGNDNRQHEQGDRIGQSGYQTREEYHHNISNCYDEESDNKDEVEPLDCDERLRDGFSSSSLPCLFAEEAKKDKVGSSVTKTEAINERKKVHSCAETPDSNYHPSKEDTLFYVGKGGNSSAGFSSPPHFNTTTGGRRIRFTLRPTEETHSVPHHPPGFLLPPFCPRHFPPTSPAYCNYGNSPTAFVMGGGEYHNHHQTHHAMDSGCPPPELIAEDVLTLMAARALCELSSPLSAINSLPKQDRPFLPVVSFQTQNGQDLAGLYHANSLWPQGNCQDSSVTRKQHSRWML